MSAISTLPASIVSWLGNQSQLSEIRFMTEYPAKKKAIPLKNAIVAVGLEEVKIEDSFTANDQGVLTENEYCRNATMKIKLAIHIPFAQGGAKCHDVFSMIVDCLTFASDLNIIESGCMDIVADRDTDALVLNAWIITQADFCPAVSTGLNFQSFLDKELLCGSHIRSSTIHVTENEKERWNTPFVTDSYTGVGNSTKTVSVGFKPSIVIVFAQETATVAPVSGTLNHNVYFGIATESFGTLGISLTNSGFTVKSGQSHMLDDCIPCFNSAGISYSYIAIK